MTEILETTAVKKPLHLLEKYQLTCRTLVYIHLYLPIVVENNNKQKKKKGNTILIYSSNISVTVTN